MKLYTNLKLVSVGRQCVYPSDSYYASITDCNNNGKTFNISLTKDTYNKIIKKLMKAKSALPVSLVLEEK